MTHEQEIALYKIAAAAVVSERKTGVPAEVTTAQCWLESGGLKHAPENNCFGIKDTDRYPGAQYVFTKEIVNGKEETQKLAFEVYPTLADCFTDHGKLISGGFHLPKNPNIYYLPFVAYQTNKDVTAFVKAIAPHYASAEKDPDPAKRYSTLVLTLINQKSFKAAIAQARA